MLQTKCYIFIRKKSWELFFPSYYGVFNSEFCDAKMKEIEAKWKDRFRKSVNDSKNQLSLPKFYVLSMFPYPSGQLHMGHVRVYSISDTFARYYKMKGFSVIHPMGWDAFGLPAENAAKQHNIEPKKWISDNVSVMRKQLEQLGCDFDWDRELNTSDPKYYKWTQLIFLKLYSCGLAYQQEAVVNWDPLDQTVLAEEQVDSNGCSWRSGAVVRKRNLRQWFFRTTAFAKDLYEGLLGGTDDSGFRYWRDIIKIQQHWIGKPDGIRINFRLVPQSIEEVVDYDFVSLWTSKPEDLFQARFIVLSSVHVLNRRELVMNNENVVVDDKGSKVISICQLNLFAQRPLDGALLPLVIIKEDQEIIEGDIRLGLPLTSSIDRSIECNLKNVPFVQHPGQTFPSHLNPNNSSEICSALRSIPGAGGHPCSSYLRDWLVSRQRYWGTPIPIVHCSKCGTVPVPEEQLPIELPSYEEVMNQTYDCVSDSNKIKECLSPLARVKSWVNVNCPKCGASGASRETDTLDTFVDSSWYFLRYLDNKNSHELIDPLMAVNGMPVDLYVGGKEHATLHLFYARFMSHFLNQVGLCPVKEPFYKLLVQGMVKGKSYRVKGSGRYLRQDELKIDANDPKKVYEASTGQAVVVEWEKMSKSKFNGIQPGQVLERYGSDTTRLLMLSDVSPLSDRNWSEDSFVRIRNMQNRLLKLVLLARELQNETLPEIAESVYNAEKLQLWDARNYYLKGISYAYDVTRNLAMVMAKIQGLVSELWSVSGQVKRDTCEFQRGLGVALISLAPISPFLAAELWSQFSLVTHKHTDDFMWGDMVIYQKWPRLDPNYNMKFIIKKNGREIATIPVALSRLSEMKDKMSALSFIKSQMENDSDFVDLFDCKLFSWDSTYVFVENYEASINFFKTNEQVSLEEKEEIRRRRKIEKEEKKRKRDAKIKYLAERESLKAAKSSKLHH